MGIQYLKYSNQEAYGNFTSISQYSSETSIRIPHAILYKNDQPKPSAGVDKETSKQRNNLMRSDKGHPAPRDYTKTKSDSNCRPGLDRQQAR